MSWIPVFIIALTSAFFLLIVGIAVIRLAGFKTRFELPFAIVISVFIISCASLLSPLCGWSIPVVLLEILAILAVIFLVGRRICGSVQLKTQLLVFGSEYHSVAWGLVSAFLFLFLALCLSGSQPSDVLQLYDAPFHLSIVRHISETGNASPFGAGVVAGNSTSVYPDVVHAVSALFLPFVNDDIQTSVWVTEMMFVAVFFSIGSLELTKTICNQGEKNHSWQPSLSKPLMAAIAMLLPVILPLSAVYMLVWGPLYENAAACAMLPAMLAVLIERVERLSEKSAERFSDVAVILLIFLCAGFCHPNTCFVLGIFMLPYVMSKFDSLKIRSLIAGCAVLLWTALFYSPFFKRTVNCDDRIVIGSGYGQRLFSALHLDYSHFCNNELFVLLLFVVMLCIVFLVTKKLRSKFCWGWYAFGLGFLAVMATMTLFPNTFTGRFLTGFFYVDTIRFCFIFQCLVSPFLVAVILNLWRRSTNCAIMRRKIIKSVGILAFFVLVVFQLRYYGEHLDIKRINEESNIEVTFNSEDVAIFDEIKEIVGDDGVINDFYDCSLWSYSLTGVNVAVRANVPNHLAATDAQLEEIMSNLSNLGSAESYFATLRKKCEELNYHYVLQVEERRKQTIGIDEKGRWYLKDSGEFSVVKDSTKGFTNCDTWESSSGKMTLYRIDFN